ncbi:response regulator [Magnetovibrio blakemorei]|uniref:Response regulatory domain-containing protein n=1 Tax=Magnetovibrio blakemorei TaxID=28181 RepID=A0A1E5Q7R9_9PROT|nr:response regulator [Magnetovibrio blakemorei]OEJ67173.1 hypothetical protein BEN30_10380 [Magnetovibrio blakemorei]
MSPTSFSSLCVLIVDDDVFARHILTRVLEQLGVVQILEAEDGEKALALMAETEHTIGLIITDISMPEIDGWSFARRVRYGAVERFKGLPILMLTGNDTDANAQKARTHKINGFVVKPPQAETLSPLISKALKETS